MPEQLLLAIDQGTTGTTSLVVDIGVPGPPPLLARGQAASPPTFPAPGRVEISPDVLWQSVEASVTLAIDELAARRRLSRRAAMSLLQGVALTNQRETALAWQAGSGACMGPGIVWQDRRTAALCEQLKADGREATLREQTGLVADPYFSASKWLWLLEHEEAASRQAKLGDLLLGTVDSYLLYRLTGGREHKTDTTNAARTGLYALRERQFSAELCALWGGVPISCLPTICASDAYFGDTRGLSFLPDGLPIVAMLGDQHAALVGQGCCREGLMKCTLGTGGFALVHTGSAIRATDRSLIQTVAYDLGGEPRYALEGSMFVAGALVEWLQHGMGLVEKPSDVGRLAAQCEDTGGVLMVPALTGLGAPHWRPEARGLILGLGRQTRPPHLARAALEGIALQSAELLLHMAKESGAKSGPVRMDGGAAADDLLLQMHADCLGRTVVRPRSVEATGIGAALVGAVGLGLQSERDLELAFAEERSFAPLLGEQERQQKLAAWQRAVACA